MIRGGSKLAVNVLSREETRASSGRMYVTHSSRPYVVPNPIAFRFHFDDSETFFPSKIESSHSTSCQATVKELNHMSEPRDGLKLRLIRNTCP